MKFYFQAILTYVFLSLAVNANAQLGLDSIVSNIETQVASFPIEKIYVHTDRPYYVVGDDIWMSTYVVNGNDHKEDPVSSLAYVELLSPERKVIASRHVQLDGKFGSAVIKTDQELVPGKYIIRAYTNYMLNYLYEFAYSKEIMLFGKGDYPSENNQAVGQPIRLRFYPEGGELVQGINSKVAFEVSDTTVKSIEVQDGLGNLVTTGKVIHDGIGFFNITPIAGAGYVVKCKRKNFPLPSVLRDGYGLKVNNLGKNSMYVDVMCSERLDLSGAFLIGHVRGLVFLQKEGLTGLKSGVKIDKSSLPDGVAQFTLFNSRGKPVAERSVFLNREENIIDVKASIPYQYLNVRQKADLAIELKDQSAQSVDGDLSVSVVDAGLVIEQDQVPNIKSYLLLGSELTSTVPNINSYFENTKKAAYYVDLLMMTRGWSRIRWQDITTSVFPQLSRTPESGFVVSGTVTRRGDPVSAKVELSVFKDVYTGDAIQTDASGRFRFNLQGIQDSSQVYVKAFIPDPADPSKNDTKRLAVTLDPVNKFDIESENIMQFDGPESMDMEAYVLQSFKIRTLDSIYDVEWSIELDEVSIKGKNLSIDKKIQQEFGIPYSNYSNRVILDSLPTGVQGKSIFDIVRDNVPGVEVLGTPGLDQRFRVRGGSSSLLLSNDATVLVDGIEVSVESLNGFRSDRVAFIDVLKGAATSIIYGGSNGVVAIYTKQPTEQTLINDFRLPDHSKNILYKGYIDDRDFYSPDYSKSFAGSEKPDIRTTLYWNPRITTKSGIGKASFYTSDKLTQYLIEVQGITKDGRPFVGYDLLEVR